MPDAEYACAAGGGNSTIGEAGTYDVYLANTLDKFYVMNPGKTPADAGQAEVVIIDYTNCQMELVGSGVAAQDGATADLVWTWGNVLLASNGGKPVKAGDVYTWTWNNVVLTADGWKVRVLNAAESGGVANFDLGDGSVDKTASPNAQASNDGNIYVTAGTYNITLVIDAATDTKTVTVAAVAAAPADPWATAAKFVNGADATDDALMKEIAAYADATNLYVRVTATAALDGANYLDVSFCDGNGEKAVWWGWTTTGTNTYWKEHKGTVDAEGNLTAMQFSFNGEYKDIAVKSEKAGDNVVWTLTYPREYVASYVANGKIYVSALLWKDWGYWAAPARGNAMLEVTLP